MPETTGLPQVVHGLAEPPLPPAPALPEDDEQDAAVLDSALDADDALDALDVVLLETAEPLVPHAKARAPMQKTTSPRPVEREERAWFTA